MSGRAFLGVEASLTGAFWQGPSDEVQRRSEQILQMTDQPAGLANILARLDVTPEAVADYLDPKLRDLMPDPMALRDMDKAIARLCAAIEAKERIAIFADYDVDGATSAALLIDFLRQLGLEASVYIPDRIDEGYGPNRPAMERLTKEHSLIICVDCGTRSFDAVENLGVDVVILDHHQGGEVLPDVHAIVNPNRQDESGIAAHLCAAGIVFLTLVAINAKRRAAGQATPDLMSMLDLVALGTVADVAPLIGVNRAFVRQGLKVMATRHRVGLAALADQAKLNSAPTSYTLGYVLGPRINAGGRVGQADLGVKLLTCQDQYEARALAERLDLYNTQRREIEAEVQAEALVQAETRDLTGPLLWAAKDGWHPGVVGIVAARLKGQTDRPSVVIGFEGDQGKGSARSVTGVDLGHAIAQLAHEGLIEQGGGHKMAAGLSLTRAQLEPAMARLTELMQKAGAGERGAKRLRVDGLLMPMAATPDFLAQLEQAGPYGANAPAPRFVFSDVGISFTKPVGDGHLQFSFTSDDQSRLDGIAFGAMQSAIGPALRDHGGKRFHLAGQLELDTWGGRRKVKLRLDDAAFAN